MSVSSRDSETLVVRRHLAHMRVSWVFFLITIPVAAVACYNLPRLDPAAATPTVVTLVGLGASLWVAFTAERDSRARLDRGKRAFAVDGMGPVRSPVGLSGAILEAKVVVVSGSAFAAENLSRAVRAAGRQIASVVAAPAAIGLGSLSDEERELGAITIDFGAGLTAYAAWRNGGLHACGAIPVGGDLLTRDIALGLRVSREDADEIKLDMSGPDADAAELPECDGVDLEEIVDARLEEVLLLVERRLGVRDLASAFGSGVALAGAGARIAGIEEKARRILGIPARVARPELEGVTGVNLSAPENALGAGLLRWSFDGAPRVETRQARWGTGWLASTFRWLAAGF